MTQIGTISAVKFVSKALTVVSIPRTLKWFSWGVLALSVPVMWGGGRVVQAVKFFKNLWNIVSDPEVTVASQWLKDFHLVKPWLIVTSRILSMVRSFVNLSESANDLNESVKGLSKTPSSDGGVLRVVLQEDKQLGHFLGGKPALFFKHTIPHVARKVGQIFTRTALVGWHAADFLEEITASKDEVAERALV
jgi:hypothetical protein